MAFRFILIFLFVLPLVPSSAQVRPAFLQEDIEEGEIKPICYCKPGVRNKSRTRGFSLTFGHVGGGEFQGEDEVLNPPLTNFKKNQSFELNVKAPIVLKDNFNLIVGYKLFKESFDIDNLGDQYANVLGTLRGKSLRSSTLSATVAKPLDETHFIIASFRYASSGNYGKFMSFGSQYGVYKFYGIYGIKKTEDKEWGVGLSASKSFRRTTVLPFLFFNKNFNGRWGMEAVFPGSIFGRCNFNDGAIVLFGAEFGSKSYRLEEENNAVDPFDFAYNHSELMFSARIEKQITKWVWANFRIGYRMNFSSDFESKNTNYSDFMVEPTNAFFIRAGVFLSPPTRE